MWTKFNSATSPAQVTSSFIGGSAARADWQAHQAVIRVRRIVIGLAIAWVAVINVTFFSTVLREFAPELLSTIMQVLR